MAKKIIVCKDCGQKKPHHAKGLCVMCYLRHWRKENPESERAAVNRWRQKNREEYLAYQRCYYEEHREERLAHINQWQRENPAKVANLNAKRRARKMVMANTLTPEQLEFERKIGEATHLGEKIDLHHIVPLSKGGGHTWGNIAFIPASLNRSIGDKLPEEIYKQLALFCR